MLFPVMTVHCPLCMPSHQVACGKRRQLSEDQRRQLRQAWPVHRKAASFTASSAPASGARLDERRRLLGACRHFRAALAQPSLAKRCCTACLSCRRQQRKQGGQLSNRRCTAAGGVACRGPLQAGLRWTNSRQAAAAAASSSHAPRSTSGMHVQPAALFCCCKAAQRTSGFSGPIFITRCSPPTSFSTSSFTHRLRHQRNGSFQHTAPPRTAWRPLRTAWAQGLGG